MIHIQNLIDAVGLGAVYALIAVGIGLVFGVLRLINFAYGQLIMVAAYALAFTDSWPDLASVAIARALAADPKVLLLDEPSLGLAPKLVDLVFETLGVIRDRGVAVLLVEQRAQRTVALADRTHVLTQGQLRMTLTPKDAADTERLVAAYLA